MNGLKVWISTLIEYDQFGNATVLKSFTKIASDSTAKQKERKKVTKPAQNVTVEEEQLW